MCESMVTAGALALLQGCWTLDGVEFCLKVSQIRLQKGK